MENSYRYFQNNECKYFPCHKVENNDKFNCLFCFCPLYFVDECGGNCNNNYGIKDCSECIIPHGENGYDYIIEKVSKKINEKRVKSE